MVNLVVEIKEEVLPRRWRGIHRRFVEATVKPQEALKQGRMSVCITDVLIDLQARCGGASGRFRVPTSGLGGRYTNGYAKTTWSVFMEPSGNRTRAKSPHSIWPEARSLDYDTQSGTRF